MEPFLGPTLTKSPWSWCGDCGGLGATLIVLGVQVTWGTEINCVVWTLGGLLADVHVGAFQPVAWLTRELKRSQDASKCPQTGLRGFWEQSACLRPCGRAWMAAISCICFDVRAWLLGFGADGYCTLFLLMDSDGLFAVHLQPPTSIHSVRSGLPSKVIGPSADFEEKA